VAGLTEDVPSSANGVLADTGCDAVVICAERSLDRYGAAPLATAQVRGTASVLNQVLMVTDRADRHSLTGARVRQ